MDPITLPLVAAAYVISYTLSDAGEASKILLRRLKLKYRKKQWKISDLRDMKFV